jgi:PAS domain S-box-containing protein
LRPIPDGVAERLTGWSSREAQGEQLETVLSVADSAGDQHVVDLSCVVDGLGRVVGASITLRDVTNARKAESDLVTMAQQLRAVVDTAVDGVLMFDAAGTILMLNPACERLFGYSSGEMTGRSIEIIMPSPLSTAFGRPLLHIDRPESRRPVVVASRETICRRRDRSTFPAEISVGEANHPGQPMFVGVVHDVSERKELEAALLDAVGREQRRFGTDLHDGLGQELTGLSLLLSALTSAARAGGLPHRVAPSTQVSQARHRQMRWCDPLR